MKEHQQNSTTPVRILLAVSALLLVIWSFAVPIFETPDEMHHWQVARYIHEYWELPMYTPRIVEGNSPPLYYLLLAPVASDSQIPPPLWQYTVNGAMQTLFGARLLQNAWDDFAHYWPLRVARLITVCISFATVAFTYLSAKEASSKTTVALVCMALVAFLPQFTFRGGGISNDAMVAATSAVAVYTMIRVIRRGFSWQWGILAAVATASAVLSKTTAIYMLAPLVLAVYSRGTPWHKNITRMLGVVLVAGIVLAPWLIRNQILYNDPLVRGEMHTAVSGLIDEKSITSPYFYTLFPVELTRSFIGVFGWLNVFLPDWMYVVYGSVVVVGLILLGWQVAIRSVNRHIVALLALCVILNLAVVVVINLTLTQPQGRFLFPSLSALMLLVGLGYAPLLRGWTHSARVLALALGLLNVYILGWIYIPAYWPPITPSIADATIALPPDQVINAQIDARHQVITLVSADPQVVSHQSFCASCYPLLVLSLQAYINNEIIDGVVFFTTDTNQQLETNQLGFRWKGDGKPHQIVVPMATHQHWQGTITSVRVDPVDGQIANQAVGKQVVIDNTYVTSNLARETIPLPR